jgi:hypothetical protein
MTFAEWVKDQPYGVMKRLEREHGFGYQTLSRVKRGERLKRYDIARRLSAATGGAVSIADLCEAQEHETRKAG